MSSFFAEQADNRRPYSVSELSRALKAHVEEGFESVAVRGEISGLSVTQSGHAYFTLKDSEAVLDAVCWRSKLQRLAHRPEEGFEVIASGTLTTYPKRSRYQIIVDQLQPAGEGALLRLLQERKARLQKEGLFDEAHKRPLPFLPRRIALVTSERGAVLHDVLHRIHERCPVAVSVFPVPVQGEKAQAAIVAALRNVVRVEEVDVVIVARGGGSIEDLWVFNEEAVVRAAAACPLPLISAIGHETDRTLLDDVADLRAPTPSAAAEKVVPVRQELTRRIRDGHERIEQALQRGVKQERERVQGYAQRLQASLRHGAAHAHARLSECRHSLEGVLTKRLTLARERFLRVQLSPSWVRESVQRARSNLQHDHQRAERAVQTLLREQGSTLLRLRRLLESLSYKNILERGFAIVRYKGKLLRSARHLRTGEVIEALFADESRVAARVTTRVAAHATAEQSGQASLDIRAKGEGNA